MNITLNIDKVREEKLKNAMRKDKRPFTQNEVKSFFLDYIDHRYANG